MEELFAGKFIFRRGLKEFLVKKFVLTAEAMKKEGELRRELISKICQPRYHRD
jgi:hypothetical protein